MIAGILYLLMAAVLAWIMPEEGFQRSRPEAHKTWQTMLATLKDGLRLVCRRTVLAVVLFISAIYGLSSSGFDNLWTLHVLENLTFPAIGSFEPVVWFGLIRTCESLLGLLGTEIARRDVNVHSQPILIRSLLFLTGATAVCMFFFGLTASFWLAAGLYCLILGLRTTIDPIYRTWVNLNTESSVRATVLSIENQSFSLGSMFGGQAVGALGSLVSLPVALATTGLVRLPVAAVFAWLLHFAQKRPKALESTF